MRAITEVRMRGFRIESLPRKVACELTTPVSSSAINFLYASNEVNLMAIFGTIPVVTAPSPL